MGNQGAKKFEGGQISITFNNRMFSFIAGETVSGEVRLNLQQPLFPVKDLTFGLYGHEHTHYIFEQKDEDGNVSYNHRYGNFDIIKLEVPLTEFVDGPPRPGTWTYPFTL